jgi:hypothetical protein
MTLVGIMKRIGNYLLIHFEGEETNLSLCSIIRNYAVMTCSLCGMNSHITKQAVLFDIRDEKHGESTFCHVLWLLSSLTTGKSKDSAFRSRAKSYAVSH